MREGLPSITASAVAFARGIASLRGRGRGPAIDPAAPVLLPVPLGATLRALDPLSARTEAFRFAARFVSAGLVDHLALRTAAIDALLRRTLAEGRHPQLVILGAGLDARAFRIRELEHVTVFEVDHPATQAFKQRRAGALARLAKEVRFVAVDFERERLDDRLAHEGHDASVPTLWLWEGVVPYLEPAVTERTLAMIAARSTPTSRVALTYGVDEHMLFRGRLATPIHLAFRAIGEPLRGLMSKERMHAMLAGAGFRAVEDTGSHDWSAHFGWGIDALLLIGERLVAADRL